MVCPRLSNQISLRRSRFAFFAVGVAGWLIPVITGIPPLVTQGDLRQRRWRLGLVTVSLVLGIGVAAGGSYLFAHNSEQLTRLLSGAG